jgi:hypothetical protein
MKVNYKEGELVYVPSEVTMNKYNSFDSKKCVVDHVTTKTPEYLLVVDQCILAPGNWVSFLTGILGSLTIKMFIAVTGRELHLIN